MTALALLYLGTLLASTIVCAYYRACYDQERMRRQCVEDDLANLEFERQILLQQLRDDPRRELVDPEIRMN